MRNWRPLPHIRVADASFSLTRWQHITFLREVMAAILKFWRQIKILTPSIDAYLPEEQSCQISSRSDLKRRSLGLFWRGRPNKKNTNNKKDRLCSDMRSVPDLESFNESICWNERTEIIFCSYLMPSEYIFCPVTHIEMSGSRADTQCERREKITRPESPLCVIKNVHRSHSDVGARHLR